MNKKIKKTISRDYRARNSYVIAHFESTSYWADDGEGRRIISVRSNISINRHQLKQLHNGPCTANS